MDKCDTQYKQQIYQSKRRGQNRCEYTQIDYWTRNRSFSKDRNTSYRGRGNFGRNYRQNYRERDHKTILGMTIEEIIIENRGLEIGVAVEIITGIPIEVEKTLERTIHDIEIIVEIEVGQDNHAPNLEEKREGI